MPLHHLFLCSTDLGVHSAGDLARPSSGLAREKYSSSLDYRLLPILMMILWASVTISWYLKSYFAVSSVQYRLILAASCIGCGLDIPSSSGFTLLTLAKAYAHAAWLWGQSDKACSCVRCSSHLQRCIVGAFASLRRALVCGVNLPLRSLRSCGFTLPRRGFFFGSHPGKRISRFSFARICASEYRIFLSFVQLSFFFSSHSSRRLFSSSVL